MKDSIVGDPIFWPGLVYSPINLGGLLFALGSVTSDIGLIFEEFSEDAAIAVCREKTADGWKRVKAAISLKSSEYIPAEISPDMLICWVDDADPGSIKLPVLELSRIKGGMESKNPRFERPEKRLQEIFKQDPSEDLLRRGESILDFEETVRQLDERIKKLKNVQ